MRMVLLKKSDIAGKKSIERKQQIDEGLKLAKRVDALREVSAQEESSLTKFRLSTVSVLSEDILAKTIERDALESGNQILRDERIRLETPIDLTREWEQVASNKKSNQEWNDDLLNREIGLTERENDVTDVQNGFSERERAISEKESWIIQAISETHLAHQEALNDRREAQNSLQKSNSEIETRYSLLSSKEQVLNEKEIDLVSRETQVQEDQESIINDKKFLADQRKTLERGFAELRRKQNASNDTKGRPNKG